MKSGYILFPDWSGYEVSIFGPISQERNSDAAGPLLTLSSTSVVLTFLDNVQHCFLSLSLSEVIKVRQDETISTQTIDRVRTNFPR